MSESRLSDADIDLVLHRVREEVRQRRAAANARAPGAIMPERRRAPQIDFAIEPAPLPRLPESAGTIERKSEYALADFLRYHDEDFIRNAYRGVLRREADATGHDAFLHELRVGERSKTEILGRMRYSREGRATAVRIRGLPVAFALRTARRIPVVGRALGVAQYLLRLPDLVRNHERLEAVMFHQRTQTARALNELAAALDLRDAQSRGALARFVETRDADLRTWQDGAVRQIGHLAERLSERGEAHRRELVAALERAAAQSEPRFAQLRELVAQTREALMQEMHERIPTAPDYEANGRFDTVYAALEDRLRGARKDILGRLEIYVPTLRAAGAGVAESPVIDLGCGRGELLELLRNHDLVALGVDANAQMVDLCLAQDLRAVACDALEFLRARPADSAGAITAMHVIEHLPFPKLLALLEETRRVLRSGAVAIFETPNPENLIVGANTFWYDPTHVKPLPPELMKLVAEITGFTRVEVLRLHPVSGDRHLTEGPASVSTRLNELLYGWQDYAVLAYKA